MTIARFRPRVPLASIVLLGAMAACGGDEDEGAGPSGGVTWTAEAEPLSGFAFDTGLIPAGSPAQVSLELSAGGKVRVAASGKVEGGAVVGTAGSGTLALDLHVKMAGRLKIDNPLKQVDGPLPGLDDIDVPIAATAAFDPFLVEEGQRAEVAAAVPETKLPPIPLGSVPGKLELTVTSKSRVTSVLRGRCLSVASGKATYLGEATTSGTLVLTGRLLVELPAPLNAPVDLGTIEVPIPESRVALDSEAEAVPGAADGAVGRACGAVAGPDAGGGGATDGGGGVGVENGGTLESLPPVRFGGGPYCTYEVTLSDISVSARIAGRTVEALTVQNKVTERVVGECEFPAAPPSEQRFTLPAPARDGDVMQLQGAADNQPKADMTVVITANERGPVASIRWTRNDVPAPVAWEAKATVQLEPEP